MIIYIDKSIAKHGNLTDSEEVMFTELACAHRRGDCYLCGAQDSIDRLKNELRIFQKGIGTRYAEIPALINAVETLIVISYDDEPTLPQIISEKQNRPGAVRIISVNEAINYRLNNQCILLGESLLDCDFYRLLATRYMYLNRKTIRGVWPALVDEIGGGDSMSKSLEKCVRNNHNLVFCLTDSDIKYDRSRKFGAAPSIGNTARYLDTSKEDLDSEGLGNLFELYRLEVHEVENLIPFAVLEAVANSKTKEMLPGIAYLRKLKAANLTHAILFYDFKKGNNIDALRQACKNPESKKKPRLAYWEEIAQQIGDESAPCLGEYVLSTSLEHMKKSGYIYLDASELDEHLVDIWNTIGKKVFSWGCANKPNAANPSRC